MSRHLIRVNAPASWVGDTTHPAPRVRPLPHSQTTGLPGQQGQSGHCA